MTLFKLAGLNSILATEQSKKRCPVLRVNNLPGETQLTTNFNTM